jgi:hypothetical protein
MGNEEGREVRDKIGPTRVGILDCSTTRRGCRHVSEWMWVRWVYRRVRRQQVTKTLRFLQKRSPNCDF